MCMCVILIDYVGNRPDQWAPTGGNQVSGSFIYTLGVQQLHFDTAGQALRSEVQQAYCLPSSKVSHFLEQCQEWMFQIRKRSNRSTLEMSIVVFNCI